MLPVNHVHLLLGGMLIINGHSTTGSFFNPIDLNTAPSSYTAGVEASSSAYNAPYPANPMMPPSVASNANLNPMATPDTFNPHFGALNSPSRRLGTRLPPETRVAWLEYLANVYVQCDDFAHARETIDEMYYWLVEHPRLRRDISVSVQMLQRRIDERHDCLLRSYGPDACYKDPVSPTVRGPRETARKLADVTAIAASNLAQVMGRVPLAAFQALTDKERHRLRRIFKMLKNGYVTAAMAEFRQVLAEFPDVVEKEAIRKFEFVLKLVKFDLENPDNCMPLWRTTCCMDWKIKRRILDVYELLKGTSGPVSSSNGSNHPLSRDEILERIRDVPMFPEIKTRLLVATGRPEAWDSLRFLRLQDAYLARACLTLKGIRSLSYPSSPPSPVYGEALRVPVAATSSIDGMQARAQAEEIYQHCLADRRLSSVASRRCQEGLSEIRGLEKSCPYGGFVRIGLFSMIFGNYLFVKCLSPPTTLPDYHSFLPLNLTPPPPSSARLSPNFSLRQMRGVERLGELMEDFRTILGRLQPAHRVALERIQRLAPVVERPTTSYRLERDFGDRLEQMTLRLKDYLRGIRDIDMERRAPLTRSAGYDYGARAYNSQPTYYSQQAPSSSSAFLPSGGYYQYYVQRPADSQRSGSYDLQNGSAHKVLEQISDALVDLYSDLQRPETDRYY